MVRTQILLPPALYNELKLKASSEGRSLSDVVREALRHLFTKKERTGKEMLAELAKDAFSAPHAPRDLSTNDEYLYGKDAP